MHLKNLYILFNSFAKLYLKQFNGNSKINTTKQQTHHVLLNLKSKEDQNSSENELFENVRNVQEHFKNIQHIFFSNASIPGLTWNFGFIAL